MARERYPGERRGLSLFLEDLRPTVAEACGTDSLMAHAIRRALRTGDLHHLRHARSLFNHLPREQRYALSAACVMAVDRGKLPAHALHDGDREPSAYIAFEQQGELPEAQRTDLSLTREPGPASALRAMVRPGTLPSATADGLRRMAGLIEGDRRLRSERCWRDRGRAEDGDVQTPSSPS